MPDFEIEREILGNGFQAVAGVDEAGRGALCGPVVAASVIFPCIIIEKGAEGWLLEVDDSKSLSPRKRERLARKILNSAHSVGIGLSSSLEVDKMNIHQASLAAMKKAVLEMSRPPDFLLIDGFCLRDLDCPQRGLPQGDRKSLSVAAASIIAKVLRDRIMSRLEMIWEGYGLSRNKGYGTREHFQVLKALGPTLIHRQSFNLKPNREGKR